METKNTPTCLMLAADLELPVSLASVFETTDLKDTGIEFNSHITILYSDSYFEKENLIPELQKIINESKLALAGGFRIMDFLKTQNEIDKPVLDLFDLGNFENESGYVVLKLKTNTGLFDILSTMHYGLEKRFGIKSTFKEYNPHLTLAEVQPGTSKKYIESKELQNILKYGRVKFEDLIYSLDLGKKEYSVYDLTHFNSVDRFFRIEGNKKFAKELNDL